MGCEIETLPCFNKNKEDYINPLLEKVRNIQ